MTKLYFVHVLLLCILLPACNSSSGSVTDKVLQDFGIRDRPEGYVSGGDRVLERMDSVGQRELKRMNMESRLGEVIFEEQGDLRGKYYKEVKVYERYYAVDAEAAGRARTRDRGYVGQIEYSYRVYQSARKSTRAEAAALTAGIPTSKRGTETYRYRFSLSGVWNGADGIPAGR